MATGTLFFAPIQLAEDTNNDPSNGALLYFYLAGTATPASVYRNVDLTGAYTYPIQADSAGRFAAIYLTPGTSYKVDLQNSSGVSLDGYPCDNVAAIPNTSGTVEVSGTAGVGFTDRQLGYLSDGSGSLVAGSWYIATNANTYSSTKPVIGFAMSSLNAMDQGLWQTDGRVTGLSGLTPGTDYWVSTNGGLTSTPGVLQRYVGQADTATSLIMQRGPSTSAMPKIDTGICEFRLTLTTGTPVTTGNVTAATTLYLSPYQGNRIALYDAAGNATIYSSAEMSIAVPNTSDTMYDVWCYQNSGVPTLELTAWTNTTTRATAIVTTVSVGNYTKSGDATRRYVGSFSTTGSSGQTEDSVTNRLVFNNKSRLIRRLERIETTTSWSYNSNTIRQANASASNQVRIVLGVSEDPVWAMVNVSATIDTGGNVAEAGVGLDSTTAFAAEQVGIAVQAGANNTFIPIISRYEAYIAVGRHVLSWNEAVQTGTTTFQSNSNNSTRVSSGIVGEVRA